jgi:hypothetical protein
MTVCPKVTIKDAEALKSIEIENIKEYLTGHGWYKREDLQRTLASGEKNTVGELWTQDMGPQARTAVVVPGKQTFSDYAARMSEMLMSLERVEGRSQLEIYVDITKIPVILKPKKAKKKKNGT